MQRDEAARGGADQRVAVAMDDDRRRRDLAQPTRAVTAGGDRVELARDARWVVATVPGRSCQPAEPGFVERIGGRAMTRNVRSMSSTSSSRLRAARATRVASARRVGIDTVRLPLWVMISASERTRSGWR